MSDNLPLPDQKFVWYDHPVGFHLYIREDLEGKYPDQSEKFERVIFGQQAQASFHSRKSMINQDEFNDVEPLSDRIIDFLWTLEEERNAVSNDEEDKAESLAELRRWIYEGMEYKEKAITNAIMNLIARDEGVDTGVPEVEELIEHGHQEANHDDRGDIYEDDRE